MSFFYGNRFMGSSKLLEHGINDMLIMFLLLGFLKASLRTFFSSTRTILLCLHSSICRWNHLSCFFWYSSQVYHDSSQLRICYERLGSTGLLLGWYNYYSSCRGPIFISKKLAEEIIECVGMFSCKPCPTSVDTKPKLSATSSTPFEDLSHYCSLVRAL